MNNTKISFAQFPAINTSLCTKCGKCISMCKLNAIHEKANFTCSKCTKYCLTMQVPCAPDYIIFDYQLCDRCGACIENCPEKAIGWFYVGQ